MSDEEAVTRYARDLCQQLGVPELNPQKVSWSPLSRILVLYGSVRLPRRMMGHLTPDEWKPLIASSLIYEGLVGNARYRKLNDKKRLLTFFLQNLIANLLLVGVILLSFRVNGDAYKLVLLIGGLAGWMAFELPMTRRFLFVKTKELQFRADKEATNIVETAAFLRVPDKIDKMGLDKTRLGGLLRIEISARQRIEKLQNH
jgi:hypothetical protein